jgi:hypothetical protein
VLLQKSLTGVNTLDDAKGMLDDVKLRLRGEPGFFSPQGSIVNYFSIYQSAQNIWRKIGKISSVNPAQQTVDTRFLDAAAEFFPGASTPWPTTSRNRVQARLRRRRPHPHQDGVDLLPSGRRSRRERQGRARLPGRRPRRHLRQRLPPRLRQHRQRGQPRRQREAVAARADAVAQ